jgi:phospholipase C
MSRSSVERVAIPLATYRQPDGCDRVPFWLFPREAPGWDGGPASIVPLTGWRAPVPAYRRPIDRRTFLGASAATVAAAGLSAALPFGLPEAVAGPSRAGTLDDVEHVVILMQENRSFDHYFGTMRGVRGFGDRAALQLSTGRDVFHQPDLLRLDGGYLLPFHIDTAKVDGQDIGSLLHDWDTTHIATNGGHYDQWPLAKTEMTMGYFTEADIPYHRALAQAFTICDNYHCSIQSETTPNRIYHWTGTIDPDGVAGGPAVDNPPDYQPVYHWTTYPERLQAAGISWQVYANDEVGDDMSGAQGYVGDYGDNPLWLFQAYHDALASSDPAVRQLAERASLRATWLPNSGLGKDVNHVIAQFRADCAAGTLPAVSWVVAPYLYSEHPAGRPVDGEAYMQGVLSALWANPELWSKTVVLINYDENDGLFDHVPPPVPPPGTPHEFLPAIEPIGFGLPPALGPATPIGLGPRVPMTVVSPWSRGGWVNSQVFDHTSALRFLENWTGVREENISAWRRSICGDLMSCFDFASYDTTIPLLPDTAALRDRADRTEGSLPRPRTPGLGQQVAPAQDPGSVPARPLPYQPLANVTVAANVALAMHNAGDADLNLGVHAHHLLTDAVTNHDVAAGGSTSATIGLDLLTGAYDVWLHGPNGFLRRFAGDASTTRLGVEAAVTITGPVAHPTLQLTVTNGGSASAVVRYTGADATTSTRTVAAHASFSISVDPLAATHGWYDFTIVVDGHPALIRRFAGHLENGQPSLTG